MPLQPEWEEGFWGQYFYPPLSFGSKGPTVDVSTLTPNVEVCKTTYYIYYILYTIYYVCKTICTIHLLHILHILHTEYYLSTLMPNVEVCACMCMCGVCVCVCVCVCACACACVCA